MLGNVKKFLKGIPVVGDVLVGASRRIRAIDKGTFTDTASYWEERYASGGNSGGGSYNRLAEFKAQVLNDLIAKEKIASAIEFGCGDGNQLALISYPRYIGLDVSKTTIQRCSRRFSNDRSKSFFLYDPSAFHDNGKIFQADLSLSLDVLYHIVEEEAFTKYLGDLFRSSGNLVVVYSSDYDSYQLKHVKHRKFSSYVAKDFPEFKLVNHIKNPYPYSEEDEENTSLADFYIYRKETNK
jgi:hypothetical protein